MKDVRRECRLGKAHKLPFNGHFQRASNVGAVVHSDIVCPLEPSYPERYRYFEKSQDDYSRYDFAGMMQYKSDVIYAFEASHIFIKLHSRFGGTLNVRA